MKIRQSKDGPITNIFIYLLIDFHVDRAGSLNWSKSQGLDRKESPKRLAMEDSLVIYNI